VLDSPSALWDALRDRQKFARELGSGGMATVWLAESAPGLPAGHHGSGGIQHGPFSTPTE